MTTESKVAEKDSPANNNKGKRLPDGLIGRLIS